MNRKRRPINVGGSSLFAVLIILCLTAFSVLSLLTARSELALTSRAADSTTAFYEAEYQAALRFIEIQAEVLENPYKYSIGETISYTVDIDEQRELKVVLRVNQNSLSPIVWTAASKVEASGQYEEQWSEPQPGLMIFEE